MADCPNCGTEVRPEWSLCPHCKVNMRTFAGPPRGRTPRPVPVAAPMPPAPVKPPAPTAAPVASLQAPAAPVVAPAPGAPLVFPPAVSAPNAPGEACPQCGAVVTTVDAQFCLQCGRRLNQLPLVDRVRQGLSNPFVVGGLAVIFMLLLAGLLLANGAGGPVQFDEAGTQVSSEAGGQIRMGDASPIVTLPITRPPVIQVPEVIPVGVNASPNATPRALETVLTVHTLSRYIQNAGGDGNQIPNRTPIVPSSQAPLSPVPTSTIRPGPIGNLVWAGEGSYATPPFRLDAGEVRLDLTAEQLTMAQLLDLNQTAFGIATAGPSPGGTTIRIPVSGDYRIEVWPFGTGLWTARVTNLAASSTPALTPSPSQETVATLAPVTTTATPLPVVSVETSSMPTVLPIPETTIPIPTASPTLTPPPTQAPHTYTGNGTAVTPYFQLLPGVAVFRYQYTGDGPFSITLIDGGGTVTDRVVQVNGTIAGSKAVSIPRQENYLLNIAAGGAWEISIG